MVAKGNPEALEGMISIIDLALAEEIDPEIEKLLTAHRDICQDNRFCIYDRAGLERLSASVMETVRSVRELDKAERPLYLVLEHLKFRIQHLT